jgi:Flp pilus assembly pilin Flp
MRKVLTRFLQGLIATGISIAIIAVLQTLGSDSNTTFTGVAIALK